MTKSSRVLVVLILSPYLIWSMGGRSEASDAREKESALEKPTSSGTSQPPVASDGQPPPPKPAPEIKPQLPGAPAPKSDASTEHKEVAPEKPGTGSSQAPTGSDSQPTTPKPAPEAKPHPPATPAPAPKGEVSTEHKEVAPEKPASDSQPTTPKLVPEAKPQPPVVPAPKSDASTEHKEVAPKKPASDSQPTTPKLVPEAKPQPPVVPAPKSDASTEHKEVAPKKPASDSQPTTPKLVPEAKPQPPATPTMKADLPPDHEVKDKEPALRKTLGSLILSVKLALMGDSRLFHYEIEVEDDEQTVTLSGRVSTEEEKATAKEVAQKVHGVKTVVNKLTVEKDLAKVLSRKQDDALTSLIKERFSKSATLKAANFEVKTEEGVVLLNGTVRFQVIALEAAEAARQVPGVRAVNTEKVRLEGEG